MIIREKLIHLLKTGSLKHIFFGVTHQQLVGLLGHTTWKFYPSEQATFPSIYKYDRIEFYFDNTTEAGRLYGIIFQPIPTPDTEDRENLVFNYHRLTKKTTIDKVSIFLKKHDIKFEEKPAPWDNETRLLWTEGQVELVFDCQRRPGHFVLHKIGKFWGSRWYGCKELSTVHRYIP